MLPTYSTHPFCNEQRGPWTPRLCSNHGHVATSEDIPIAMT